MDIGAIGEVRPWLKLHEAIGLELWTLAQERDRVLIDHFVDHFLAMPAPLHFQSGFGTASGTLTPQSQALFIQSRSVP